MEIVYILDHVYEVESGEERHKMIGAYTSRENAEAALARVRGMPGFRDHVDGFCISETPLNRDHWEEGFVNGQEAVDDIMRQIAERRAREEG
jgi:hypothetical protein